MSRQSPAQTEYQRQLDERAKLKAMAMAMMREEPMLSTREISERCGATIADVMLWEASL